MSKTPSVADFACWSDADHPTTAHPDFGWPLCARCGAAPDYPERLTFLARDVALPLFAITAPSPVITPRSAIVGTPRPNSDGSWPVHFEDGTENSGRGAMDQWGTGVRNAAGRLVVNYPSTTQSTLVPETALRVGTYWPESERIEVNDALAVAAWLEG